MKLSRGKGVYSALLQTVLGTGFLLAGVAGVVAEPPESAQPAMSDPSSGNHGGQKGSKGDPPAPVCEPASLGSPYFPVDSWVYPAVLRLYGLGFLDRVFLDMRPWTRSSISRMLEDVAARIEDADAGPETDQAQKLYDALAHELRYDMTGPCMALKGNTRVESVYSVVRAISGTPLRDSYHLGSSIINDYGRPYSNGFNNYTGASGYASAGRFTLYARGEFQGAPSATGYSPALALAIAQDIDLTTYTDPVTKLPVYLPQVTIPLGPISSTTTGRVMEAYVSALVLSHEISFGKQDDWLGPGLGGAFAYSNNAENIYSFRINRVEPLRVPGLSYITGPFRYEFVIGALHGHTYIQNPSYPGPNQPDALNPGDPWVHVEKISFRPTENLEFGFERTAIWGGKGHGPITIHTFLRSFFSLSSPSSSVKNGRDDPGARFGAFDFSYRLPFVRNWLTLYADGEVHDDISPIDAPRRASWRPGLYLSHMPGVPNLDVRVEAVETDPPVATSHSGRFMYYEAIQKQGYTNSGQIFGDWVGREGKGGQAWITYHLSGNEWIQISARNHKTAKDFIAITTIQNGVAVKTEYGTTLNDISFQAVKRIGKDFEVNGNFTYEQYNAPIYLPGAQTITTTDVQLTWFPARKVNF